MACLLSIVLNPIMAQTSVLSVGVRGGGQMWLPSTVTGVTADVRSGMGYTGALDLRYTFYCDVSNTASMGLAVGAGAGYGSTVLQGTNVDAFSNTDYLGNQLDYTATTAFQQTDRFAKAEASLLLAMRFGGVTLNIGPRFMMPFADSHLLKVTQSTIDAYFPQYNVHVVNEQATGVLPTPLMRQEKVRCRNITCCLPRKSATNGLLTNNTSSDYKRIWTSAYGVPTVQPLFR